MNGDTLGRRLAVIQARLDHAAPGPLYRQVSKRLEEAIRSGLLADGESLPRQIQLAECLGVSQMTVRRAVLELKQAGLIESVRGRGTTVTSRLRAASVLPAPKRSLKTQVAGRLRLGVVFASVTDGYPFLVPVLRQMELGLPTEGDAAKPFLQSFYVDPVDHDPESIARQIPFESLDGLILMSPINTMLLAKARQYDLPCVLLFNDLSDVGSVCVLCDYLPGLYVAVERLVASGCRRAAVVTAGVVRFSTGPVLDAMAFSCRTLGLELRPDHVIHADYSQREAFGATVSLLQSDAPPDCILYCSETQAEGGLLAAEQMGVAVPEALSVVVLGSVSEDSPWSRQPSMIDMGLEDIGRRALEAVVALANGEAAPRRIVVRSRFITGRTAE